MQIVILLSYRVGVIIQHGMLDLSITNSFSLVLKDTSGINYRTINLQFPWCTCHGTQLVIYRSQNHYSLNKSSKFVFYRKFLFNFSFRQVSRYVKKTDSFKLNEVCHSKGTQVQISRKQISRKSVNPHLRCTHYTYIFYIEWEKNSYVIKKLIYWFFLFENSF